MAVFNVHVINDVQRRRLGNRPRHLQIENEFCEAGLGVFGRTEVPWGLEALGRKVLGKTEGFSPAQR